MQKKMYVKGTINNNSPNIKVIRLHLGDDQIEEWCLALSLIKFNLLDSLLLQNKDFSLNLGKLLNKTKDMASRGEVHEIGDQIELKVVEQEIDYWLEFYLQYYRDGIGIVDHIDVEIYITDANLKYDIFYLTLLVPKMAKYE